MSLLQFIDFYAVTLGSLCHPERERGPRFEFACKDKMGASDGI